MVCTLFFSAIRFEVTVKEDRLSKLCDIVGKHNLCISDRELAFEEIGTRRIKYAFHFAWMRKFGRQVDVFLFECGRNCPNGAGEVHCQTVDSSKIHDIVTAKSCSAAKRTVDINHARSMHVQQEVNATAHSQSTSHTLPPGIDINIGAPTLVTNALRKHPGNIKQPELIPIQPKMSPSSVTPPTPKKLVPERKSVFNNSKDSFKKHGPVTDKFTKELEDKILTHPPVEDSGRHSKSEGKHKRDLRKSKEKKSDKEDKKSREDRKSEKEDKKSREERKSEKEDKRSREERKSGREDKKEKDEKKSKSLFSSWKKDAKAEKVEKTKPVIPDKQNLYEDPEGYLQNQSNKEQNVNGNYIYDEAISPVTKQPVVEPIEYAQPYTKKNRAKLEPAETVMYSDVQDVQDRAWATYGQETEIHEEDYLNIKSAREMKEKEMEERKNEPPPLPQKLFDIEDDTYNTLDLGKKPEAGVCDTQNVYGTAGAKAVGKLDTVVVPEAVNSDSEGSSGDLYAPSDEEEPQYEGYEAPETFRAKTQLVSKLSQKSNRITASMYEEIPSPPVTNQVRSKKFSIQDSVYDEVS